MLQSSKLHNQFTDCGLSRDIPNAVKSVDVTGPVDSGENVELEVSYTCQDQYSLVPHNQDTTHTCVNGTWVFNEFKCLIGKLKKSYILYSNNVVNG